MKQKPCETYQSAQTPEGPRTVCITCGRVRRVHKGKHNRKPRAPKKHKLTRKSLYNWAVRQAKANPTYNENRWNPEKGEHVMETLPNSAQRELAMLLWGTSLARSVSIRRVKLANCSGISLGTALLATRPWVLKRCSTNSSTCARTMEVLATRKTSSPMSRMW